MKLVILGAPGAGKGTQAERLEEHLGVSAISTGIMIRKAIRERSELGILAKEYIDNGQLVPDSVMIKLIAERLKQADCADGFILDGYPRTVAQAEDLDENDIIIDRVLSIEVDDETIIERLAGRMECGECGTPYHILHRVPIVEGICDVCGNSIVLRDDDTPEIIKKRLVAYHEITKPLKGYYSLQGKLCVADGKPNIEDTAVEVFNALGFAIK